MVTEVKEEHSRNAPPPISVTPFGIVMEVKGQEQNAPLPIVTPSGMLTEVKEEHSRNAPSPIVLTLFGMVIDFKEEHL